MPAPLVCAKGPVASPMHYNTTYETRQGRNAEIAKGSRENLTTNFVSAKTAEDANVSRKSISREDLIACTIAAKNYLSHVRVLTESFLAHHPDAEVFVLIADKIDGYLDPEQEAFHVVRLEELRIEGIEALEFKYGILEFCTALKPFFVEYLLNSGYRKVVYLDPDIMVMENLRGISTLLDNYSIVLTPHILEPIEDDYRPSELDVLLAGTYNLGFLAVADNAGTRAFLTWWKKRLWEHCVIEPFGGLHVDQKWVELAFAFFDGIHILRDAGYNVAYWNMVSRRLTTRGGQYLVNDEPLYFFHFSGFDPEHPKTISKYQNRFGMADKLEYRPLFESYRALLYSNGYEKTKSWPWAFDYFDNGVRIQSSAKKMYRQSAKLQRKYPKPFCVNGEDSYYRFWKKQNRKTLSKMLANAVAITRKSREVIGERGVKDFLRRAMVKIRKGEFDAGSPLPSEHLPRLSDLDFSLSRDEDEGERV